MLPSSIDWVFPLRVAFQKAIQLASEGHKRQRNGALIHMEVW